MRHSFAMLAVLATTTTTQAAESLTMWLPGPENNPSSASRFMESTRYPPIATILSSAPSTTIFALGCPTSAGAPSSISHDGYWETCIWSTDSATYSIISSTLHVLHRSQESPSASMWWSCTHDVVQTSMKCDLEITGDVNDNTNGTVEDAVWRKDPDRLGNVFAMATVEVASEGKFGLTALSTGSEGMPSATASEPRVTSAASGSAATESAGAAGVFGIDAVRLAALVGGAAAAVW